MRYVYPFRAMQAPMLVIVGALACWGGNLTQPQQRQVAALEAKLLAPCCYQEPVGRHQSEAALRMRLEIASLVEAGRTESEIVDTYVRRYGSKVVADYAPTPGWAQYSPWLLTLAAAIVLAWWIHRKVRDHARAQLLAG